MKYVYTKELCSACTELKNDLIDKGVEYVERRGDRLNADPRVMDAIDKEAFVQLQQQNGTFPVVVVD